MKFLFLLVLGLVLISGCVSEPQNDQLVLQDFSDFFKNTSISVQDNPTVSSSQAISDFKKQYPGALVSVNTDLGIPDRIGDFESKKYLGKPWEAAVKFLQENQNLFQIKSNSIYLSTYSDDSSWYDIGFEQKHKDIRVTGAHINVRVTKNNSVDLVTANYFPNINISTDFRLSISEVKEAAKKYYEKTLQTKYNKDVFGEIEIEDYDIQKVILSFRVNSYSNYSYQLVLLVDVPNYQLTINDKTGAVSEEYRGPITTDAEPGDQA